MRMNETYEPEKYWTEVGERIERREQGPDVIAGDDEPYYRYKRECFLKLLREIYFEGLAVLEVGCGPGGNLAELAKLGPRSLTGADISEQMLKLARMKSLPGVELVKTNGNQLPFRDRSFDVVMTVTVLQHNTNEQVLNALVGEIARVSRKRVILFERVGKKVNGDELCLGRPVAYYSALMEAEGYRLVSVQSLKIRCSYYVCGLMRKMLSPKTRNEGEPVSRLLRRMQQLVLPITRRADRYWNSSEDLTKLEFVRRE